MQKLQSNKVSNTFVFYGMVVSPSNLKPCSLGHMVIPWGNLNNFSKEEKFKLIPEAT
jgi:hypothetical protein